MSKLLAQKVCFVADGCLQATLYDLGRYPGAVLSTNPAEQVKGEVYLLHQAPKLFEILDDYEECTQRHPPPHEYKRVVAEIVTSEGTTLLAWTYLYNRPIETLLRISSGDYVQFLRSHIRGNCDILIFNENDY